MPKLEGSSLCWVQKDGKATLYRVQFIFTSYEQMLKAAILSESVKFQAAMRGSHKMPDSVASFEEEPLQKA